MTRLTLLWLSFTYIWTTWAVLDGWLWRLAAVGAAILALGTIWKKGIVPVVVFVKRMSTGIDALFDLKDWQCEWSAETQVWREGMEQRVEALEKHLEADVTVRHEITGSHHQ